MLLGTNVEYAHQYNRRIILETIRLHEPISKAELSRQTGLTSQAIGNTIEQFLAQGVVEPRGKQTSRRGQPAQLLGLRAKGGFSAGLHLDRDHLTGVLLDLSGQPLARSHLEWNFPRPEEALPELLRSLDHLLLESGVTQHQLWGVGVSLPGPIEVDTGRLMSPPNFVGWNGTAPRTWLEERLSVPVYVETDSTAAAIGERWYGAGRSHANLFYVFLGMGVGGGLLADGQPFRGASGAATMFGHTPAGNEGRPCPCGGTDCLETYLSIPTMLRELSSSGPEVRTVDEVVSSIESADTRVLAWLRLAATRLATSLIGAKTLVDPEIIIIGGRWPQGILKPLVALVIEEVRRREPKIVAPAQIVQAELGDDSALGAATIALFNSITPSTQVLGKVRSG